MVVFISNGKKKLHVSAYSGHLQVLTTFLLKEFYILLSAVQLFVSFGLLNYFFPFLPLLRPLFPIGHPCLPQIIPHIVFPSYSWPSLRSCCIRFPFVYGLGHSFTGHSFYMPQPAQSFVFYISYYIFVINCFFQFLFICPAFNN